MQIFTLRQNKAFFRCTVISAILLLFIASLPVYAQDTTSIDTLRQMGKAFAGIAEKASPAVVWVTANKIVAQDRPTMRDWPFDSPAEPFEDDLFERFFGPRYRRYRAPQRKYRQAQGSGFLISTDGYILTNNHLVENAEEIKVKLADEREFEAEIIGTDPDSDVAVIRIEAKGLTALELADSDAIEVGEWVLAIGNPLNLSHTVTAGIVSAKGRSGFGLAEYENFIQTDAAINRGNSGGPLLNLDGKVIGINTAILSRTGGNMGIGLAIPINTAKNVYEQLIESGTVVRGQLGVTIQTLTPKLAAPFGLEDAKGVLIANVDEDSPAEKAGLKRGDVIIEFDGKDIEKADVLKTRVAMLKPGTKVKIAVLRDGKRKTFVAKLGERPGRGQIAAERSETLEELGLSVQELTDDLAQRFGYEGLAGVIVTQVKSGSAADEVGITGGMLIMEVNQRQVSNRKEFKKAVEKAGEQGYVLLLIRHKRSTFYVPVTLKKRK